MPTTLGRNHDDAASGTMPRRADTKPKLAPSDPRRVSPGGVIVTPTPTAGPFTAAITGLVLLKIRSVTSPPSSRCTPEGPPAPALSNVAPPVPRSAPAQKPRPRP